MAFCVNLQWESEAQRGDWKAEATPSPERAKAGLRFWDLKTFMPRCITFYYVFYTVTSLHEFV